MVAVPLADVAVGRVLAFCACASKCLPMKSGRSEGGKVMDARVAAVRGSVSGCMVMRHATPKTREVLVMKDETIM
jgi:hypothetical protein